MLDSNPPRQELKSVAEDSQAFRSEPIVDGETICRPSAGDAVHLTDYRDCRIRPALETRQDRTLSDRGSYKLHGRQVVDWAAHLSFRQLSVLTLVRFSTSGLGSPYRTWVSFLKRCQHRPASASRRGRILQAWEARKPCDISFALGAGPLCV